MIRAAVLITLALWASPARADLEAEVFERYRKAIVRIKVVGTKQGGGACDVKGTGFFVDTAGHILTAGHTVAPCGSSNLGAAQWSTRPTITVTRVVGAGANTQDVSAVVIYEDRQTDLALLRASVPESQPLPLAPPGTLAVNDRVSLLTFQESLVEPADREVTVDSLFNPSERHDGLIDISGSDIIQSASGAPVLDRGYYVAAIFTKGQGATAEGAVPISFAATLFQLSGVSYPSSEVREVIEELSKDVVEWELDFDSTTQNMTLDFKKRLRTGKSPVRFKATFRVFTRTGRFSDSAFSLTHEKTVPANPVPAKEGRVLFEGIGREIDGQISAANEHRRRENATQIGVKDYAEVTIEAQFSEGPWITAVSDRRLEFE